MSFLDPHSLRTISGVSRRHHLLANDQNHWRRICVENGINLPLIEDLGSQDDKTAINWKRVWLRAVQIKERNLFFDLLIRKTSDETLFGCGLQRVVDITLEPVEKCRQCSEEKSLLKVTCRQVSRVLWDLPTQPRSFLDHTLKIGCDWSQMQTRSRVPREFLLDYNQDSFINQPVDLDSLRLVEEQY